MKRKPYQSPYFWALVAALTVVVVAWVGRERYRPITTGTGAPDFTALDMQGRETRLESQRTARI